MNILVTGGSGFIGTVLVTDLLKAGHNVRIYDKRKSKTYPDKCIIGDVRDRAVLTQALKNIGTVYHLAAEHKDDVQPISLYYEVNVEGAKNLVYACEKNGISRLIFTSSVALYGLNAHNPDEESEITPFNDYGKSKYEAELIFNTWVNEDVSRALTIIRPSVIFGKGNRGNVYNLIRQIASGKFIMVGKGRNCKSMGYVLNISRFLTMQLHIGPGMSIYNFADKPDMTSEELIETALRALGKTSGIQIRLPYWLGLTGGYIFDFLAKLTFRQYSISSIRVKKFCADTQICSEKVKKSGFIPPYTLIEGLKSFISSDFETKTFNKSQ